jgi:hypothetical protein
VVVPESVWVPARVPALRRRWLTVYAPFIVSVPL